MLYYYSTKEVKRNDSAIQGTFDDSETLIFALRMVNGKDTDS